MEGGRRVISFWGELSRLYVTGKVLPYTRVECQNSEDNSWRGEKNLPIKPESPQERRKSERYAAQTDSINFTTGQKTSDGSTCKKKTSGDISGSLQP